MSGFEDVRRRTIDASGVEELAADVLCAQRLTRCSDVKRNRWSKLNAGSLQREGFLPNPFFYKRADSHNEDMFISCKRSLGDKVRYS